MQFGADEGIEIMSEVSAKQESAKSLGLDGTRVGGSLASGQQEHAASQPVESSSTEDESVMFKSDSFRMNCMKVSLIPLARALTSSTYTGVCAEKVATCLGYVAFRSCFTPIHEKFPKAFAMLKLNHTFLLNQRSLSENLLLLSAGPALLQAIRAW